VGFNAENKTGNCGKTPPDAAYFAKVGFDTAEKCQSGQRRRPAEKWVLTPPKTKKESKSNDFTRHSQTLVGPQKWAVYPFSKTAKLLNCGNPQSFFIVFSLLPEPVLQDELLLRSISVRRISEKSLLGRDVKTIP
jgi:hypothetical protein